MPITWSSNVAVTPPWSLWIPPSMPEPRDTRIIASGPSGEDVGSISFEDDVGEVVLEEEFAPRSASLAIAASSRDCARPWLGRYMERKARIASSVNSVWVKKVLDTGPDWGGGMDRFIIRVMLGSERRALHQACFVKSSRCSIL